MILTDKQHEQVLEVMDLINSVINPLAEDDQYAAEVVLLGLKIYTELFAEKTGVNCVISSIESFTKDGIEN